MPLTTTDYKHIILNDRQVPVIEGSTMKVIEDDLVLSRATELGRIVFSQDRDLLVEAQQRQIEGISFPGVVYGHQLMVRIGDCIRDLELIAKLGEPQEFENQVQFLPL